MTSPVNVWHFWAAWKTLFHFGKALIRKFEGTLFRLPRQVGIFAGFAAVLAAKFAQAATPAYVQSNSVDPQTPQRIVKLPYIAPQPDMTKINASDEFYAVLSEARDQVGEALCETQRMCVARN